MANNSVPVSIQGLTLQTSGSGTAMLSQAQANQLLQKLRGIQGSGASGTQTIKIQAIQTNPTTGAKQIVAIPIQQGTSSAPQVQVRQSPVKVIKIPASQAGQVQIQSASSLPAGVKVVKLAAGGAGTSGQTVTTVYSPQTTQNKVTISSPMSTPIQIDQSGESRKRSDIDFDSFSDAKRRKTEKGGKGLRHFSMKVCEKVQAKGTTSYNEVADELVNELTDPRCSSPTDQQYDQKNIRRRVYDALNVLMAMNIISKEKKEIRWLGLPTNSIQEANSLEVDKSNRMDRIKAKTQQLQDLILQQIAFKNLVERNKEREKQEGVPAPNSAIQLPFIIVNTSKKTVIDCSISNDKMEYLFNFDDTFEIHDDMEVLKRMNLCFGLEKGEVSQPDLSKARGMVPRALEQYVTQLAENKGEPKMPKVSPPKIIKQELPDSELGADHHSDEDFDVDV